MNVTKRSAVLLLGIMVLLVMVSVQPVDAATGTEWIDVDSFDATYEEWTQITGASPWLDAQDHPTNYIRESKDELVDHGWFGFPDTTLTGTLTVNVSIWGFADDTDDGVHIFVDKTGSGGGSDEGILIVDQNTGSYKTLALGTMSVAEVNALRIFLRTTDTVMDDIEIDHMRLGVSGTVLAGTDYTATPSGTFALGGDTSLVTDFVKALVEGFTLAGDTSLIAGFVKTLVEGFTLAGSTSLFAGFVKTLIEGFALTGTTNIFVIIQKIIVEGFTLAGDTSLIVNFSVLLASGFALAGITSLIADFSVRLSVGFSLGGAVSAAVAYVKTLIEGFSLAGTITAFKVLIVNLADSFSFGVGVDILKIVGTSLIGSMFFQLFFGLSMWSYLGPIGVVILGYFIAKMDRGLAVLMFVVESLIIANYLTLVSATPAYWWHTFILLIGCILTLMYSVGDR